MPQTVGYARVSTFEQSLDLQIDALREIGCDRIFEDNASGSKSSRPGLEAALAYLRKGDTLACWRLDRLGRSLRHLLQVVNQLNEEGKSFRCLQENIDTSTSTGKLVFHLFGALAEFERDLIRERTKAGLAAARARGKKGGRPKILDEKKIALARAMLKDPESNVSEVAATLGVSRATMYTHHKPQNGRTHDEETANTLSGHNGDAGPDRRNGADLPAGQIEAV